MLGFQKVCQPFDPVEAAQPALSEPANFRFSELATMAVEPDGAKAHAAF